jgi:ribose/xylose/arabinose/galactoside ABC-type transport system permease subunit
MPSIFRRSEVGLALAIVIVLGLATLLDPLRTYVNNPPSLIDIVRQATLLGVFALGSAVVIIAGGIDLSAGSMVAFSGSVCASIMLLLAPDRLVSGEPVGAGVITIAIAGTLAVGFLVGSLHAWLITVVGLPPFIATLATLQGLRSLSRSIVENVTKHVYGGSKSQIEVSDAGFRYLATSVWIPVTLFLALAALLWLMMARTVVGRHLYALGGNEAATRLSGIRTDRLKWLAYCIGALCSSLAGILYVGELSVASPLSLGQGFELNAIAAAVVGGCSLQGGVGTIPGVVLGCVFLRVVIDGIAKVIKVGADVYQGLIVGIVLVVAVALNQRRFGQQAFPGALGATALVCLALLAGGLTMLLGSKEAGWAAGLGALVLLTGVKLVQERRSRARQTASP